MSEAKKLFSEARKKGESEIKLGKGYARVCYDKEFDKYKRKLWCYIDGKKGVWIGGERSKEQLQKIIDFNRK